VKIMRYLDVKRKYHFIVIVLVLIAPIIITPNFISKSEINSDNAINDSTLDLEQRISLVDSYIELADGTIISKEDYEVGLANENDRVDAELCQQTLIKEQFNNYSLVLEIDLPSIPASIVHGTLVIFGLPLINSQVEGALLYDTIFSFTFSIQFHSPINVYNCYLSIDYIDKYYRKHEIAVPFKMENPLEINNELGSFWTTNVYYHQNNDLVEINGKIRCDTKTCPSYNEFYVEAIIRNDLGKWYKLTVNRDFTFSGSFLYCDILEQNNINIHVIGPSSHIYIQPQRIVLSIEKSDVSVSEIETGVVTNDDMSQIQVDYSGVISEFITNSLSSSLYNWDIPSTAIANQAFNMFVSFRNIGDMAVAGGISVSFPQGSPTVTFTGVTSVSSAYQYSFNPGDLIWPKNGDQFPALYALREIETYNWDNGIVHTIGLSVKYSSVGTFRIYFRSAMFDGTTWYGTPSSGTTLDQQGWWVYAYDVTVNYATDGYESDNTFATAKTITVGSSQSRSIAPTGDVDYARFSISYGYSLIMETSGSSGDTVMYLYYDDQTLITSNDDGGSGTFSRIAITLGPGTYYIKIVDYGNDGQIASYLLALSGSRLSAPTPYRVSVNIPSSAVEDSYFSMTASFRNDGGNAYPGCITVSFPQGSPSISFTSSTTVGTSDRFSADTGDLIWPKSGSQFPAQYSLREINAYNWANGVTHTIGLSVRYSNPGTYNIYIRSAMFDGVTWYGNPTSGTIDQQGWWVYVYSITITSAPDSYESDNSFTSFSTISMGQSQTRNIAPVGDQDYVRLIINYGYDVLIQTSGISGDTEMWLYDELYNQIAYDNDGGSGTFSRIARSLAPGVYYIRIREYGNNAEIASYILSLSGTRHSVPIPIRVSAAVPSTATVNEAFTISGTFRNNGGPAYPGGITFSFPEGSPTITFSGGTTVSSSYQYSADTGDTISPKTGSPFPALYSLREIEVPGWLGGISHTIELSVTFDTVGTYDIYLRSAMGDGTDWYGTPTTGPLDQQGWWVYVYTVQIKLPGDIYEPDNSKTQATTLLPGETQYHSILPIGDEDWFVFTIAQTSDIVLQMIGSTGNSEMWLYDELLNLLDYDDDSGPGYLSRIDYSNLLPGIYYVKIAENGNNAEITDYGIYLTRTSHPPSPNFVSINMPLTERFIGIPFIISATVRNDGGIAVAGGITISFPTGSPSVAFSDGTTVAAEFRFSADTGNIINPKSGDPFPAEYSIREIETYSWIGGSTETIELSVTYLSIGTYTIYVRSAMFDGETWYGTPNTGPLDQQGWWILQYAVTIGYPGDDYEMDNDPTLSTPISSGESQIHSIDPINDVDWCTFTISRTSNIIIETIGISGDTRLWLLNEALEEIYYDDNSGTNLFAKLAINGLLPGIYYIRIQENGDDAIIDEYTISMSATLNPPSPNFVSVNIPMVASINEAFLISTTVINTGGTATAGGITISFPEGSPIVEFTDGTTVLEEFRFSADAGDEINPKVGNPFDALYSLREIETYAWATGAIETIELSVTFDHTGYFSIYVRSAMKDGVYWYGNPLSGDLDQQGWWIDEYIVKISETGIDTQEFNNEDNGLLSGLLSRMGGFIDRTGYFDFNWNFKNIFGFGIDFNIDAYISSITDGFNVRIESSIILDKHDISFFGNMKLFKNFYEKCLDNSFWDCGIEGNFNLEFDYLTATNIIVNKEMSGGCTIYFAITDYARALIASLTPPVFVKAWDLINSGLDFFGLPTLDDRITGEFRIQIPITFGPSEPGKDCLWSVGFDLLFDIGLNLDADIEPEISIGVQPPIGESSLEYLSWKNDTGRYGAISGGMVFNFHIEPPEFLKQGIRAILFGVDPSFNIDIPIYSLYYEWAWIIFEEDPLIDTDGDGISDFDEIEGNYGFETDPLDPDTDGDGISDSEEILIYATNPLMLDSDEDLLYDYEEIYGFFDLDGDKIIDSGEYHGYFTNPNCIDTDSDYLHDIEEIVGVFIADVDLFIEIPLSDPTLFDSDYDGVSDFYESLWWLTDPMDSLSVPPTDSDNDLMPDFWEIAFGLDYLDPSDAYEDQDLDFLWAIEEYIVGTDPYNSDTDNEGLTDGDEFWLYQTDPLNPDTDSDGLNDYLEIVIWESNPFETDSDYDGLSDGDEVNTYGSDPTKIESDGDGLLDYDEVYNYFTNPGEPDSDFDGLNDNIELFTTNTNPNNPDHDGDGLSDGDEVNNYETNPLLPDTDSDGINDGDEILTYETDPTESDSDFDGLNDYDEIFVYFTEPMEPDSDFDGLNDFQEVITYSTNPNAPDSDLDSIDDYAEVITYGTNPNLPDTDGDGLTDYDELFTYSTDPILPDMDFDGLTDYAEIFTHLTNPKEPDSDFDGLNDYVEIFTYLTNPNVSDTDTDGLNDGIEVNTYNTNPNVIDSDSDNLTDYQEVIDFNTNPNLSDSDSDGISDYDEVITYLTNPNEQDTDFDALTDYDELFTYNTDPLLPDPDADGLTDYDEVITYDTDPFDADSDDDFFNDGYEVANGWDPNDPLDPDGTLDLDSDGLTNLEEGQHGTDPFDSDTDDDGLLDGEEVHNYGTIPTNPDTDGDGLIDGEEITLYNTNPTLADSDGDQLTDYDELFIHLTDPNLVDSDGDGLSDGDEINVYSTNPNLVDTDSDGLDDQEEVTLGLDNYLTDPNNSDSDNDNLTDSEEMSLGTNPNSTDSDSDGLSDYEETIIGADGYITDPLNNDSDGDSISDYDEWMLYNTNPTLIDSDGDGLTDDQEIFIYLTDPNLVDTDGDTISDKEEIEFGVDGYITDPLNSDSDNDGLLDNYEIDISYTDPTDPDSDDDLLNDGDEINTYNTNPLDVDSDNDQLNDGDEIYDHFTNPLLSDSDGDGLDDYEEVNTGIDGYITNPNAIDSDSDGLTDSEEMNLGTNPNSNDSDGDGISDYEETIEGSDGFITNPLLSDTDGDSISDYEEINTTNTDPTLYDTDGDGLNDYEEIYEYLTDANNIDSDNDSISDGEEVVEGIDTYITNPNSNDTDNDGLLDNEEVDITFTDPTDADTDNDSINDFEEIILGSDMYITDPNNPDTDDDDLEDGLEITLGTSPIDFDSDSDGVSDGAEYNDIGTDPLLPDTDGDTILDGEEIVLGSDGYITNPLNSDTDNDDLSDPYEIGTSNTDPTDDDTDNDGMPDGYEVTNNLDPLVYDSNEDLDNDGLTNLEEYENNTNPNNTDTDNDGLDDFWEVENGTNPTINDSDNDYDGDGLTNYQEYQIGTLPLDPDTDNDQLYDGYEHNTSYTDPLDADSDSDGIPDGYEVSNHLNPLENDANLDYDNDGLTNLEEYQIGTQADNPDSDSDNMPDGWERSNDLNPLVNDSQDDPDSDDLINEDEYKYNTNPHNEDTDGDGYSDGYEVANGSDPTDPYSFPESIFQKNKDLIMFISLIVGIFALIGIIFAIKRTKIKS